MLGIIKKKVKIILVIFFSVIFVVPDFVFADRPIDFTFIFPVMTPRLSSKFGNRKHPIRKVYKHHSGLDLAAPINSHVRVISNGVVVFAYKHGAYGKYIVVDHGNGYSSHYGHLSKIETEVGRKVFAGDVIGRVGSTGASTGPHLHFEWRKNGKAEDPLKVFPEFSAQASG